MLTDFNGFGHASVSSRAWYFPHCNPAPSLLPGGSGLWVCSQTLCQMMVMWLALGKPNMCFLTAFLAHLCSLTNPAHPLLFVLFFTIIIIFPRIEKVPGGKRGTSLHPGCPLLGSSGGVALSQSQAAADTCQKFSHQGLTCQWCWALPELVPSLLGCCRSPSLGLGWMSRKGTHWCGSLTGPYRASESQGTGLLKHHSFSGSSCPVLAIWSLLVKCTHCSESREGKAWGMQSSNNVIEQKHVYFLVGQSRGDQGKAEPCIIYSFF